MKLFFVTQVVDQNDAVLGAYHGWLSALAPRFERMVVICLKEGARQLPDTVSVFSLGKEHGAVSRFRYAWRFLRLAWRTRKEYDAVFIHMNQEYLLLAGWLWFLLGKPMYLWRNHYSGSLYTDAAAAFCRAVFCTSRFSYTAKYRKTRLMPVGVDLRRFYPEEGVSRAPDSVLFLARIAPSKRVEVLLDALADLRGKSAMSADIVGSPLPKDETYYAGLKQRVNEAGLASSVRFLPGVPNAQTPALYRAHDIFVNCSPSGMFDKTIFEAAACGALPLAASRDWAELAGPELIFKEGDAADLARKLAALSALGEPDKAALREQARDLAEKNGLPALVERLAAVIEETA